MLKSKIRKKVLKLRKLKNINNIKLNFFKIYNILKKYNLKNVVLDPVMIAKGG